MNSRAIQARIRGERALIPGNRSFFLRPKGKARGLALLLHGFSASPWEVLELGRFLAGKGWLCYGPRLAGHGMDQAAFDQAGAGDWKRDADEAWEALATPGKRRVLIGHSGGGVLATLIAAERPGQVERLVLGAPAFRLAPWNAPLSLFPPARWVQPVLAYPAVHPDARHWTLRYRSDRIAELYRMGRRGAKAAKSLRLPLLMLQAEVDDLVSLKRNRQVFASIPSADKEFLVYPAAEHNVFHHYNPLQKKIFARVLDFLG